MIAWHAPFIKLSSALSQKLYQNITKAHVSHKPQFETFNFFCQSIDDHNDCFPWNREIILNKLTFFFSQQKFPQKHNIAMHKNFVYSGSNDTHNTPKKNV